MIDKLVASGALPDFLIRGGIRNYLEDRIDEIADIIIGQVNITYAWISQHFTTCHSYSNNLKLEPVHPVMVSIFGEELLCTVTL